MIPGETENRSRDSFRTRKAGVRMPPACVALAVVALMGIPPAQAQLEKSGAATSLSSKKISPSSTTLRKLQPRSGDATARIRRIEPLEKVSPVTKTRPARKLSPVKKIRPTGAGESADDKGGSKAAKRPKKRNAAAFGKQVPNAASKGDGASGRPAQAGASLGAAARLKRLTTPDTTAVSGATLSPSGLTGKPTLSLRRESLDERTLRAIPGRKKAPASRDAGGLLKSPGSRGKSVGGAGFGSARVRALGDGSRPRALGEATGGFGAARLNRAVNRSDVMAGGVPGLEGESTGTTSTGTAEEYEAAESARALGLTSDGDGGVLSSYRDSAHSGADSADMLIDRSGTGAAEEAAAGLFGSAVQAQQDQDDADQAAEDQDSQAQQANEQAQDGDEMTFTEEESEANAEAAAEGDYDTEDEMSFTEEEAAESDAQSGSDDTTGCASGDPDCTGDTGITSGLDDPGGGTPDCGADGADCVGDAGPGGDDRTLRVAEDEGRGGPLSADPAAGANPTLNMLGDGGIDPEGLDAGRIDAILEDRVNPGH